MITTGMDRRRFLSTSGVLLASAGLSKSLPARAAVKTSTPQAEKLGWQLSVQLFTYRRYPLWEALDQVAALGIRNVEPRTGLPVDNQRPGVKFDENLPADVRRELKARLADRGMLMSSIFADVSAKPDQAKRIFELCKEMNTGVLVAEPLVDAFDMLEKLCEEYQIRLAVHNHQEGHSLYWKPALVLAICKNRGKRIGGCCDGGQWARSGLDPVACLEQMQGRIISFHLKDVLKKGDRGSRNTVLGEGEGDCARTLDELRRQGYRGLTTIDFEHDTPALGEDMARNVAFVEAQARRLGL